MGFTVDLTAFRELTRNLAGDDLDPIKEAMVQASDAYTQEMSLRFDSEGDGTWAPLARSTVKQRERLGFGPEHIILVRDGTLQGALMRGNPGNVFEQDVYNVVTGIGGGDTHPGYGQSHSSPSIGLIAAAQHNGAPENNLPARPILVPPSDETLNAIESFIVSGLIESIQRFHG